jgi:hypothetical protein
MNPAQSVEQRLRIAESTMEIIRLKSLYGEYADAKYTDDHQKKSQEERDQVAWRQAHCFTEDGEFYAGEFGDVKGHQALFENFRAKPFLFAVHMFTNPVISVDPSCKTASGRWLHYLMFTEDETRRTMHGIGYTYDSYRCVGDAWLIARVETRLRFLVPFTQPWTPVA